MFKFEPIRPVDYWVYPIVFFNIFLVAVVIYAAVLKFRVPALLLAFLGIWFTTNKIRRDYSPARARIHVAITLFFGALLALSVHVLTN